MSHPRDPRLRRLHTGGGGVDTLTALARLEVATEGMRAAQLERGPALAEAAEGYREHLADVGALPAPEHEIPAPSPEPVPVVAPLPPVDGAIPAPAFPYSGDGQTIVAPAPQDSPPREPESPTDRPGLPLGGDIGPSWSAAPVFSSEHRPAGWASRHDPQSRGFGVRRPGGLVAGSAPLQDVTLPIPAPLDQGTEGECVPAAVVQAENILRLLAGLPASLTMDDAAALFDWCQRNDEFPGTSGQPGTSVNAGMQGGRALGFWGSYSWAFGTRDIAQTVLRSRPVIVGVPWLSGMAQTGPGGLVQLAGEDVGIGHCLVIFALRTRGPQGQPGAHFGWLNSYGPGYGAGGVGWIHHRNLAVLLHGAGEAATPDPS